MKKLTKALLKAAFVFLIVGAAFGVASLCLGFRPVQFQEAVEEGKFNLTASSSWVDGVRDWIPDFSVGTVNVSRTYSGVQSLDLDVGAVDCRIVFYDGESWKVEGCDVPSSFQCDQSGEKLEISCKKNSWGIFHWGSSSAQVDVYVPSSQILDTFRADVGVGDLYTEDGVLKCSELELDCGVGDCEIRADIRNKGDIDVGVGDVYLALEGKQTDFNYDIECGIGSVVIGDDEYSDLGAKEKIDNKASRDLKLDCGVGDLTVEFQ